MLDKAFYGDKKYWGWVILLLIVIGLGFLFYVQQFQYGLGITGLSRDVSWGLYIGQLTFLVGVAASAVMVVIPYYLHNYKQFGKITILGEFLAIAAVIMCMLFVFVDMGQPLRVLNVILHPTPNSPMFWDMFVLSGYLGLNVLIAFVTLGAERKKVAPPRWIKPFIYLSVPWAVSIHTVTAFLYAGLVARPYWMTAILAPRFLASAFSAGPALLILFCLILRRVSKFDAGTAAIQKLGVIVTYAMSINVFFVLMEFFTVFYSAMPEHVAHFKFLYLGLDGNTRYVPWMWMSGIFAVISLIILHIPRFRKKEGLLTIACIAVFLSLWIEKGFAMVVVGFIPSPLGQVTDYWPTFPEFMISAGIYALGLLIITFLYKIALAVRNELAT